MNVRAKDSPVAISECSPAKEAVLGSGADKYALDDRMRTVELQQLPVRSPGEGHETIYKPLEE